VVAVVSLLLFLPAAAGGERQITSSPISHALDNNDNWSKDDRFLVFDTRDTIGPGIENSTSIWKVEVATGKETRLYAATPVMTGKPPQAPGVGAASFNPVADEVIFIHGPFVKDVPKSGGYAFTNRRGAIVPGDGSKTVRFVDVRDVKSGSTTPGAHRGGTHRHEYTLDGERIGFTYDDALLTPAGYGRTLGMLVKHPKAPKGASHYFVTLVPIVPANTAKPGELERADGDSWVGKKGLMRAFIGRVKEADGSYSNSLFVVDIPESVDVTTADPGTATRFPAPPKGVTVRRLTRTAASGIVRGSFDGMRIAYYAAAPDGTKQVFVIAAQGPGTPVQATSLEQGVTSGLRWHPSGNSIAVLSDNGVAAVCVKPGPLFGKATLLTRHGTEATAVEALVWSHDGRRLAYNRRVPANAGPDFRQIFITDFPDRNHNGIADPLE
jgi:hypothetical protein